MARKLTAKQIDKAQDKLIERLYYAHCNRMQISVLRIPALFRMARKLIIEGADDATVGAAMIAFVQEANNG